MTLSLVNLRAKYNSLALPVKASFWFAVCSIIQKGIQFMTVPIFTRLLSTNEYGEVALYNSWLGFCTIFITLNLHAGTFNTGMVMYEDNKYAFTSSLQSIVLTVGVFFLSVIYVFDAPFVALIRMDKHYLLLMLAQIIMFSSVSLWTTQQQYQYRFKYLAFVTLLMAILIPVLGIFAVKTYEDNVAARVYSMAGVQIVIGAFFFVFNYCKGKTFFNKEYWNFALTFAIPLIPHYLSGIILSQSDRVMIDWYCSKSDVGIYSVAYSLSMILMLVVTSINQSLAPWTFKALKDGNIIGLKQLSSMLLLLVALPILLLNLLAPEVVTLIAPSEYSEAVYVIPPVASSCFFIFLYSMFGNIEFYYHKKKYIVVASMFGATLNIILNLIFIPIFGYIAAAYTTLVCYVGFSVTHYLFSRRICITELGEKSIYDDNKIVIISFVLFVFILVSPLLYKMNVGFRYGILLCVLFATLYYRSSIKRMFGNLRNRAS